MKTLKLSSAICAILLALSFTSCNSDDGGNTNDDNPAGELALFVIDTARVKSVTVTGGNETTLIDRMENLNSYISDISISPDGTMIAYSNYQSTFNPTTSYLRELRVANIDGSNDHVVYTSSQPTISIGAIRFCSDNKVFYVAQTSYPNITRTLNVVNADGTGHQVITGGYDITDVSDDREYYLITPYTETGTAGQVQIIDRDADNGAGGLYHSEPFTASQSAGEGVITNDGKLVVIPFKEGSEMKMRIVDIAAKTASTKTLVSGLGTGWLSFHLEMAADSNRGVITLTGEDYPKSKTYVFDVTTGEVNAPFENNDENIFDVHVH